MTTKPQNIEHIDLSQTLTHLQPSELACKLNEVIDALNTKEDESLCVDCDASCVDDYKCPAEEKRIKGAPATNQTSCVK